MRVLLLEPDASGRISGGYLYNRQLSASAADVVRIVVPDADLAAATRSAAPDADTLLLVDSLFLRRATLGLLDAVRRATGCRVGALVHALPSFIARAQLQDALGSESWRPSDEELKLAAQLDVIVAPGPFIPRLLAEHGVTTPCVICLPGTAHHAQPRQKPASPARICSVATLVANKGYLDAIAALGQIRALPWHWRVVGALDTDATHTARLTRSIAEHGLGSRVTFVGALPSERVWDELQVSDVLLHPSYTENQPLIVMESLAAAVPVAGYAVGGMPELVEASGLLVPLRAHAALGQALARLLSDHDLYRECSAHAAQRARAWPNWNTSAQMLCSELVRLFGVG